MTADSKGSPPAVDVPRATVSGPGSNAQAAGVANRVARGLELGAESMTAALGTTGTDPIPRLRLRLPAGAGEAEIARAFQQALLGRGRRGGR